MRTSSIQRSTKETDISLTFRLDGTGEASVKTGLPFMDHMLTLFAVHGFFDLSIKAVGDLEVDAHHTVEDLGICLGRAMKDAVGDATGIARYGHAFVPMDEALAHVVLDLSNRPYLVCRMPPLQERVGRFETELIPEFFRAFCVHGGVTLHIHIIEGGNTHHVLEAIFKAWGQALDRATMKDPRRVGIPSSKGTL